MAGELASELASELATEISTAGLAERFANNRATLVLDVRTADEFESGHIPGATNIPHTELQSRLSEVSDAQDIVVYCEAGGRARTAIAVLSGSGYTRVMHLDGDMRAWRKDGLAVARGESAISDAAL
jgi:rhodanese-related sulfurtransferase